MTRDYVFIADVIAANRAAPLGGNRGVFNDLTGRVVTQPEYDRNGAAKSSASALTPARLAANSTGFPFRALKDGLARAVSSLGGRPRHDPSEEHHTFSGEAAPVPLPNPPHVRSMVPADRQDCAARTPHSSPDAQMPLLWRTG